MGAGMTRVTSLRLAMIVLVLAAEAALAGALVAITPVSTQAQFFEERFPFQGRRTQRGPFDWFGTQPQYDERSTQPPPDFSKAPASKRSEPKPDSGITSILVLGDAMADWLAYGLEQAYVDSPEIGILRRQRTNSGLVRAENRNDPRGEYPDWPQAARELIASQKPKFVVMMVGINDRRQIREASLALRPNRPVPSPQPDDPAALELDKTPPSDPPPAAAQAPDPSPVPLGNRTFEFRTDNWSDAYVRRIDDTINALKTSNVPVFWVGLPPIRGQKASADMAYLNDLFRSRADKAGIIYVDVWDGFVDEDGHYAQFGADFEGQTRRLRAADGVYFTQAGSRKLAHYVEREVQRWLTLRSTVALPTPEEQKIDAPAAARPGAAPTTPGSKTRPLSGPTVPLLTERPGDAEELMGSNARQLTAQDALVNKVLVSGEAVKAPAGRADDFTWPRRTVLPVGSDPVVAMTDLPMTPMLAEKPPAPPEQNGPPRGGGQQVANAAGTKEQQGRQQQQRRSGRYAESQSPYYNRDYYRRQQQPSYFGFQSLFGGYGR